MFRTLAQLIKVIFYSLLIIAGVTFAVSNRILVDLNLYPLPYKIQLPLFLFAIFIFVIGMLLGWVISRWAALKHSHIHRATRKRVEALENEIIALRAEKPLKSAILPPQ